MAEPRKYSSALREEQVGLTRRRVLAAAGQLFLDRGYAGTTVEAVAASAGVSVQTVYNVVGGKPKLVKAVYDVTLAGDDEPLSMNERPAIQAMLAETDPRRYVSRYVALGVEFHQRLGPLLRILTAQAAAGDRDLQAFVATIDAERSNGNGMFVRVFAERFGLRAGLSQARATDLVWSIFSLEMIDRLRSRGWSAAQITKWGTQVLYDLLKS